MKCSKVFYRLRVGARTFGALSWPTLIQARSVRSPDLLRMTLELLGKRRYHGSSAPVRWLLRLICCGDSR